MKHTWRVQSDDRGHFDEIVVHIGRRAEPRKRFVDGEVVANPKFRPPSNGGLVLRAEMMNDRDCFVDVAGICLWVHVDRDGNARISNAEDRRDMAKADFIHGLRDPELDKPRKRGRR